MNSMENWQIPARQAAQTNAQPRHQIRSQTRKYMQNTQASTHRQRRKHFGCKTGVIGNLKF
jgi:hypothetical protein